MNNFCWSVASAQPVCVPTLLDTGSANVYLPSRGFGKSPGGLSEQLQAETRLRLYVRGSSSPVWAVTTGTDNGGVSALIDPTLSGAISGSAIFFDVRVSYELSNGSVTLWRR